MLVTKKKLRILDVDIESRPLSFRGFRPTAEITAMAWCFADDLSSMEVYLLGRDNPEDMLWAFRSAYKEADILTGHNVKSFDLPNINGAMLEYDIPQLGSKLVQDTYTDLRKRGDIPASQEYLVDLFGIGAKVHMSQHSWRDANRLTPRGLERTRERVTGDVYDHMRLRVEMIKRGLLRPPKIWKP
jgi:DNA polymerase elongation subunit (family B)